MNVLAPASEKSFLGLSARFTFDKAYISVADTSATRASLLLEVRQPENVGAWEQFVAHYSPMIYGWCQFWKLQEADAEDVTQSLLLKLFQLMKRFDYDPSQGSFRSWLKTITRNAVVDHSRRKRAVTGGGKDTWDQLMDASAADDFARRMEQTFELELLALAKQRVRERVAAHTWEAFELNEDSELSIKEIAERTGLSVAMVYVAKSKVIRKLKEEVEEIERSIEHESLSASRRT